MQWLIDTIKDWVNAQGFLKTSFVDRGDPLAIDFTEVDFTKDGAWRDLDLSSIVPSGAKAITINMLITTQSTGDFFYVRKNGNIGIDNVSGLSTLVAFENHAGDILVPCDENRIIEYLATPAGWLVLNFTVKGWWL